MTFHYRAATAADGPIIDRLFRTGFCDTFAHLYAQADLDAFLAKFTGEAWSNELEDDRYAFLIAEDAGEPAGYIKLGPPELPVTPSGVPLELRQLYILRSWHGKGIAQHLMQWGLDTARARGAEELYLTVYTDNHRARRFYERYGFEYVAPYKFMVGNHPDEDIIMRLKL
jgi:GNAT superfamily N-acetyltransferase